MDLHCSSTRLSTQPHLVTLFGAYRLWVVAHASSHEMFHCIGDVMLPCDCLAHLKAAILTLLRLLKSYG